MLHSRWRFSILLSSLFSFTLPIVDAFAIDDGQLDARPALCRAFTGSLTDYGKGVQAAYEAATARRVRVSGKAFGVFDQPVEEAKLLSDVKAWKVCVTTDPQPTGNSPDDGFSVETIPAQRVIGTSCKGLADAKACHDLIAQYLIQNKLGILGTYLIGTDADGSQTMKVPVAPLPLPTPTPTPTTTPTATPTPQ